MSEKLEIDQDPDYIIDYIRGISCRHVVIIIPHIVDRSSRRTNRTKFKYILDKFKSSRMSRGAYVIPTFKNEDGDKIYKTLSEVNLIAGKFVYLRQTKSDFLENCKIHVYVPKEGAYE